MLKELLDAFDVVDATDEIRAVIVTGAGRAFCAGADLAAGTSTFDYSHRKAWDGLGDPGDPGDPGDSAESEEPAEQSGQRQERVTRDGGGRLTLRIFACTKPVIAAINGPAVGVGVTMTLPMDIRVAADNARIGFVFNARGLVPEAASSWFLPKVVGISQALEWCYSARIFGAQEALAGGLVRSVHPQEELIETARELAREIVRNSAPVSVALTRMMMWRMLGQDHPMAAHRIDSRAIEWSGREPDTREGISAFLEKRPAEFTGSVSEAMPDFVPWWEEPKFS